MKTPTRKDPGANLWMSTGGAFCWRLLLLGWVICSPLSGWGQQSIDVHWISPASQMLPRQLEGWRLAGRVTDISPVEFESQQPERARLIGEYGLRHLAIGVYTATRRAKVRVEVFGMVNYVAAYGAYSLERRADFKRVAVGTEGALQADGLGFIKGDYYARLSVVEGVADSAALLEMARRLDDNWGKPDADIPVLIRHLPESGLVAGTERLIAGPYGLAQFRHYDPQQDVFLLNSAGVEAVWAQYQTAGRWPLLLIEYHTPQLAATARRQVSAYFEALPEEERARRILKFKGNYIIEATDVRNKEAVEDIVDRIRYDPTIIWLKKDPLEYLRSIRGLPQFSTVRWFLTTFGYIGLMLLMAAVGGVLCGVSMFLYRRWRSRGIAGFTDGGDMLRLNLDDLILPRPKQGTHKRLPGSSR